MDSFPTTFTASIETEEFKSFQHPYHLGTIEGIAKTCIEEIFWNRIKYEHPVRTVALKFDGKIVDVFDGLWLSDSLNAALREEYDDESLAGF